MFHIGQKVVCMDDSVISFGARFTNPNGIMVRSTGDMGGLCRDKVYTVSAIAGGTHYLCLFLEEIPLRGSDDPGFRSSRFRPLVERKTDIGVLTALLDPANHEELVDG